MGLLLVLLWTEKNKQSAIISFYLLTKCNRYTTAYREGRFVWLHSLAPLGWNCGAVCAKMTVYLLMVAEKQSGKHLSTQSSKQQASELAPWIKAFGAKPRRPKISLWHLHNGSKTLTFTYCLSSALPLSTVAFALILILFFFLNATILFLFIKGLLISNITPQDCFGLFSHLVSEGWLGCTMWPRPKLALHSL